MSDTLQSAVLAVAEPGPGNSSIEPPSPAPAPHAGPADLPAGSSTSAATAPELEERLRKRLEQPLSPELQQELSRLLCLRVAGSSVLEPSALDCLHLALHALLADEPNLHFVRSLRTRLEARVADHLHPLRLAAVLRTDSSSIQVMLGLVGALVLTLLLLAASELARFYLGSLQLFGHLDVHMLVAAVLLGTLGGVTSLLVRIHDFERSDPQVPASRVIVGFAKPLVGAACAVFGMVLFKSQVLPIKLPESGTLEESCFFLTLSFVLGFSERLAQDMISQVEERFEPEGKDVHTTAAPPVSTESGQVPKS